MNINDLNSFLSNPRVLKKLTEAEPKVRLINGCYNEVSVKFAHGTRGVSLEVEVTHPTLAWQCGDKKKVRFVLYNTRAMNGGIVRIFDEDSAQEYPELFQIVSKMRKQGELSDAVAHKLSAENKKAFQEAMADLGITEEI